LKLTVPLVVVLAVVVVVVAAIVGIADSGPYNVVVVVGRFVGSIAEVGHMILNWPMVEQILKTHV
jgi:hypothetical protein